MYGAYMLKCLIVNIFLTDPGLQTLQPVTLELRRRKISIASETHSSKRPRLEKRKSVAATSEKTENVSDGEQPCVDEESEKDPKPVHLSPSRSQEDNSVVDLKAESAPDLELVHRNGPSVEPDAKLTTEDCTPVEHVKPEPPEVKGSPLPLEDVVKPAAAEEESGLPDIKTDGHENNLSGPNEIQMITTLSDASVPPPTKGEKVSDPKKSSRKCKVCTAKLPSTYGKKLCQSCTDEVLRAEQPSLLDSIRSLIKDEVHSSMATFSQMSVPQPPPPKKRKKAPVESDPDSGEIQSSGSEDNWENEGSTSTPTCRSENKKYYFSSEDMSELIGLVRSTMGVEDEEVTLTVHDEMFEGLKPKDQKGFPVHKNLRDLILHEWDLPEKGLTIPSELKNRYPLDGDNSLWETPKVDVQGGEDNLRSGCRGRFLETELTTAAFTVTTASGRAAGNDVIADPRHMMGGNIGGLSTALQNAVDKPLMPTAAFNYRFRPGVGDASE
ncbi:unnamed protein product [Ranitomeya imitator]|uniref:Uncharacterized protein n=1 Tax=Ranitomeya imitator TaxID=111125 RepID=A0ABN9MFE9_9NEOB|nr:unnamed protein product [Ranitomeya imitator]